jgi:phospholipid/cholesterol/gamma-HCH transport system substrate-binding protein
MAVAGLVVACAAACVVLLSGGGGDYHLKLRFENAGQLVKGNEVKVGGVAVGTVDDIVLADDNLAEVDVTIRDRRLTPLHEGTTAQIRQSSLSSVANRFVQLQLGPNSAAAIRDGSTLRAERTGSVVEIDSVLNTLDAATRGATQSLLHDFNGVYAGQAGAANKALLALNPALAQLKDLSQELGRDSGALKGFLVDTASVVSAVASRDPDLERALTGAASTAREVADERATLASTLHRAPGTLGEATRTLGELRRSFAELRPAAKELRRVTPRTATLVDALQPFLARSRPAITSLRMLLPDLATALKGLPGLTSQAIPAFSATQRAVDELLPILSGLRPYVPDLFHGLVTHFGNAAVSSYDANGHYARIAPVASAYSLTGAAAKLVDRPSVAGSRSGLTQRCPGGAYRRVAGSENNTPSEGVPCDPGQAP